MNPVLTVLQPAVSADCATNFWLGESYCVGTGKAGVSSTTSTKSTKSDAPHTTVHTLPDNPTQTGTICNCNKWYDVVEGDDCGTIATVFGIKLADFLKMNVSWRYKPILNSVLTCKSRPYHLTALLIFGLETAIA
jgi:hypothetical protein